MVRELAHLGYQAEVVSWRSGGCWCRGAKRGVRRNVNFFRRHLRAHAITSGYTLWKVSQAKWKTSGRAGLRRQAVQTTSASCGE